MNRQLEEEIDGAWGAMPPHLRAEVETAIGYTREELTAEVFGSLVLKYLGTRLMEVQTERRVREAVEDIRSGVREDTRSFLADLGGEVRDRLERMAEGLQERDERINYLLGNLRQQQHTLPAPSESGSHQSRNNQSSQQVIMVGTSYKQDCKYVNEGGPKDCVHIKDTPNGRFAQCQIGVQLNEKRILPRWATTAYAEVNCPSDGIHRLIRPCKYVDGKEHKIS